jgi:hypothetical protein
VGILQVNSKKATPKKCGGNTRNNAYYDDEWGIKAKMKEYRMPVI